MPTIHATPLAFALATLALSTHALAQCLPEFTSRIGGEHHHLATIDSNRILVANGQALEIYNVSNAASPVLTGRLETGQALGAMKIVAGRAYVVTTDVAGDALRSYTVSGAAPVFATVLSTADQIDFDSSGTTLFIASHQPSQSILLTALQVSSGDFPLFLGQSTLPGTTTGYTHVDLSISGSRAFIAHTTPDGARVSVLNVANPSFHTFLGHFTDPDDYTKFGTVVTFGNYGFACREFEIAVFPLDVLSTIPRAASIAHGPCYDAAVLGSTLFVASDMIGVRAYNLTNYSPSTHPPAYTAFNTPGTSSDLTIAGDRLYNADREGGVSILQIGNPADITSIGRIVAPAPSRVLDMVEASPRLYVLDELGLRILSTATDPPATLGALTLPDSRPSACSSRTLGVFNSHAYITGCDNHLRVVSVANPAAPFLRADLANFDADYDIAFFGNFAYFCSQLGVRIVNISNPAAPSVVGTYTPAGVVISAKVQGNLLYLGTRDNGVWILSLADPVNPQLLGFSPGVEQGPCYSLALSGATLFAGYSGGLEILDVSNSAAPRVVSFTTSIHPSIKHALQYRSGALHMYGSRGVGNTHGVHRIDVSNLASPVIVGSYIAPANSFAVSASRYYFGDDDRSDLVATTIQSQWAPAFRRQPQDTLPCLGAYALFNVNVSALPAEVTYRWHKDGQPLPFSAHYTGVDQPNLTVRDLTLADAGLYTCIATNSCGATASRAARLSFCPIDFNCDEFVDFFDYDDYVACFSTGACPPGRTADFNGDNFIDFFDYDDFVAAFEEGC